jgi:mono/diheme cytochrome c family protein
MTTRRIGWGLLLALGLVILAGFGTYGVGLSARRSAWPGEQRLTRLVRAWTLPRAYRRMTNPVPATAESLRAGMVHWADHCAICHANNGSGQVTVGRGLFPPAPDLRAPATQGLSDGALFYAIEDGVPFTGMPAWATGTEAGVRTSWELVLFIRHLPVLTAEELMEMERLNPKSPAQLEQEHRIREFLEGAGAPGPGQGARE